MSLNRTAIIREALKDGKWDGNNKGLAEHLTKEHGIPFKPAAVANVRSTMKRPAGKAPVQKKPRQIPPTAAPATAIARKVMSVDAAFIKQARGLLRDNNKFAQFMDDIFNAA